MEIPRTRNDISDLVVDVEVLAPPDSGLALGVWLCRFCELLIVTRSTNHTCAATRTNISNDGGLVEKNVQTTDNYLRTR